jgi:hypothetical protein
MKVMYLLTNDDGGVFYLEKVQWRQVPAACHPQRQEEGGRHRQPAPSEQALQ